MLGGTVVIVFSSIVSPLPVAPSGLLGPSYSEK